MPSRAPAGNVFESSAWQGPIEDLVVSALDAGIRAAHPATVLSGALPRTYYVSYSATVPRMTSGWSPVDPAPDETSYADAVPILEEYGVDVPRKGTDSPSG